MKITAAVLHELGASRPYHRSCPLRIEQIDLAEPGPGEVLVQMKAAGICHSDLSVIDGSRPRPTPMVLGHEAAGIVRALGPGVEDLAPGDHVVMVFVPSCGRCPACTVGRPALCEPGNAANAAGTLIGGARRLSRAGSPLNHHLGVSAFADHAVVSRNSLLKIPERIPFATAALFGCAVLTGVGAVGNTARIGLGETVAVLGLGGVGLNAVLGALAAGAAQVIAIDPLAEKREFALQLGATAAFDASVPDCAERVREATRGGVDHAIELAGSEQALELAYRITRRGGTTVTGGLAHPERRFSVQQVSLVAEERTVKGSYVGSCVPSRDLPRYLALFERGRLPVERLLSHTLALEEINEAMERLAQGQAMRQVVVW